MLKTAITMPYINILGHSNAPSLALGNASVISASALARSISITDNAPTTANNTPANNNAPTNNAPAPIHNVAAFNYAPTCYNISTPRNVPDPAPTPSTPTLNNAPAPVINNIPSPALKNVSTAPAVSSTAFAVNAPIPNSNKNRSCSHQCSHSQ